MSSGMLVASMGILLIGLLSCINEVCFNRSIYGRETPLMVVLRNPEDSDLASGFLEILAYQTKRDARAFSPRDSNKDCPMQLETCAVRLDLDILREALASVLNILSCLRCKRLASHRVVAMWLSISRLQYIRCS